MSLVDYGSSSDEEGGGAAAAAASDLGVDMPTGGVRSHRKVTAAPTVVPRVRVFFLFFFFSFSSLFNLPPLFIVLLQI